MLIFQLKCVKYAKNIYGRKLQMEFRTQQT